MLKKNPKDSGQDDLFRMRLEMIINPRHELVILAKILDWDSLERDLSQYYCDDNGRPGGCIRLMVGLCLLKDIHGLSNEELCRVWRENPYFQYFCGEEYFQHDFPVKPPSISIFRSRIGEPGAERLLEETIKAGLATGTVSEKEVKVVNVDTTVQEKAVRFPTDSQLCHKAREALLGLAKAHGIGLRQSYVRKGKESLFLANRYMASRKIKKAKKEMKKVKNYLGRVIRDIERGIDQDPTLMFEPGFKRVLDKAHTIYNQAGNPKAKEKLYSWHAPEVECIAKGKVHKKYEFGCKASYVSTNKSNFIVGAMALHGRPYDGKTLKKALDQTTQLTGIRPKEANVDLGYRGHGINKQETHVITPRQKANLTKAQQKRKKRRNAIEPIIGHLKNDRKVGPRNWLQGKLGDKINAIAMAVGFNLRKILKVIFLYLFYRAGLLAFVVALTIPDPKNRLFYG